MALLGTFIDKNLGNTLVGPTTTTTPHSVGTTPDLQLVVQRSLASATTPSVVIGMGANASLSTVFAPSVLGAAATQFDVWNFLFWSGIR